MAGRRRFLLQTLGLAAAGLAAGGTAGWAQNQMEAGAQAAVAAEGLQGQLSDLAARNSALDLAAAGLRGELSMAQGQNQQLAEALSAAQQESAALKEQMAGLQSELQSANERIGQYRGLTGLFEQLEGTGLDAAARAGLDAMAGGLAAALGVAPLLSSGLALVQERLAAFESDLPGLEAAMAWLGEQVALLKVSLQWLELKAGQFSAGAVTGAVAVFGGAAGFILDHMPFGLGQGVRETLAAVQEVILRASQAAEQTEPEVLRRLSPHLTVGPGHWGEALVRPVREQALTPAGQLLETLSTAEATFSAQLQAPVQGALAQRAALREQIAAYRAAHQI